VTDDPGSADPRSHRLAGAWSAFQDWRRVRPFWGGLFLVASGIEFFLSGHLDLLPVKLSFGPQSFLGWLIPLALLLCGLLLWFTPAQRAFYGILGAAISVSALIGLNLGGFFIGMLLGIVGGALGFSWTPQQPLEPAEPVEEELADSSPEPAGRHQAGSGEPSGAWPEAGSGEPPPGPATRLVSLFLITLAVTVGLLALPAPSPAAAAPCPAAAPVAGPAAPPSPAPPESLGQAVGGFFQQLGRLLGIGGTPAPPTSPSPAPSTAPSGPACPAPSASGRPSTPPTSKAPAPPTKARRLAVPAGQPVVNEVPSKQITARLSQSGLSFDGIVDLPTHSGTIRTLQFSMRSSTSTPFELRVLAPNGGTISLRSSSLTVSGRVRFYTTEIKGKLLGLLPVTFTPESPPPLVLPELFFTNATVRLVFVRCDKLTAPALHISYL
jgi:hypothetical protein